MRQVFQLMIYIFKSLLFKKRRYWRISHLSGESSLISRRWLITPRENIGVNIYSLSLSMSTRFWWHDFYSPGFCSQGFLLIRFLLTWFSVTWLSFDKLFVDITFNEVAFGDMAFSRQNFTHMIVLRWLCLHDLLIWFLLT